jgi:hypothetical protein
VTASRRLNADRGELVAEAGLAEDGVTQPELRIVKGERENDIAQASVLYCNQAVDKFPDAILTCTIPCSYG